uniref:Uncharacterized protein n=1 Tax=Rhizophora mucronata TaxID=61149 RepID=A0A2P2KZV8_RHIMU
MKYEALAISSRENNEGSTFCAVQPETPSATATTPPL